MVKLVDSPELEKEFELEFEEDPEEELRESVLT
jgi:hypothetical protein